MLEVKEGQEMVQMKENVRRAVDALELCWRCQRISECQKYVLGNMVLVWLCPCCLTELLQPQLVSAKARTRRGASRKAVSKSPA